MRIVAKAILAIILFLGITTPIHAAEPARQAVMATPPPGYGQGVGNVTQDSWAQRAAPHDVPGRRYLYLGGTQPEACAQSPFCILVQNETCGRWAEITLNGLPVNVVTPTDLVSSRWLPLTADTNSDPGINDVKSLMPPANCDKLDDGTWQRKEPSVGWLVLDVLLGSPSINIDVTPYAGAEPRYPFAPQPLNVPMGDRRIPSLFSSVTLVPVGCHDTENFGRAPYITLPNCQ